MSSRCYVAVALVVGMALVTTALASKSSPVRAQEQASTANDADRLGGVRFVFHDLKSAEDEAARADAVMNAGAKAGWTESRVDRPGTITLLPPPNYNPDMFGDL